MHEVKSDTSVEFFVTPGYGEKLRGMLHYSQAVRIGDRVEISGQGGWDDDRFHGANALFRTIPAAGHFPWIENPASVRAAFAELAERILAS